MDSSITQVEKVKENIKRLLCLAGAAPAILDQLGDDGDLFEAGVLDSMALIQFVMGLEKTFSIQIPTGDFDVVNFNTLDAIIRLVMRRLSASSAP